MRASLSVALAVLLLASAARADLYFHNPRGSNNRLNEETGTRTNNDRLFDSQNNNRGGYNVGDKTDTAFDGTNSLPALSEQYSMTDYSVPAQYSLVYFASASAAAPTILTLEWTNQHACGGNEGTDAQKDNCNLVAQYMCDTNSASTGFTYRVGTTADLSMEIKLMDGGNTNTPQSDATTWAGVAADQTTNNNNKVGRHENEYYYFECRTRTRNKGLFLADQKLQGDTAIFTRQNPGGGQSGLECSEERDYYPYWAPSPWRDIAIMTDHVELCPYYLANSQNTAAAHKCTTATGSTTALAANNPTDCATAGGTWVAYKHNIPAPDCLQAAWSRDNHLGNGRFGYALTYNWTLPTFTELTNSGVDTISYAINGLSAAKCVMRMRYNISTDDYDPWNTTASSNDNPNAGIRSPVENNPVVDVGAKFQGIQLAINTNQFGRTFQDRSHLFYIINRPSSFSSRTIYNLNVRGKRGNIVETYPTVEYDFVPQRLHVQEGDMIHVQWTGSNTQFNDNPAGDGQAGDDGQGQGGTDRSNFVAACSPGDNYPAPFDTTLTRSCNILQQASGTTQTTPTGCFDMTGASVDPLTCAVRFASSGYYQSLASISTQTEMDVTLNNAPASLVGGLLLQPSRLATDASTGKSTQYFYFSTRNNSFTNRSQKGVIIVDPAS